MIGALIRSLIRRTRSNREIQTLSALHRRMLNNFRLATAEEPGWFKSEHWDHFVEDFEHIIADEKMWCQFRRNGITAGFDDTLRPRNDGYERFVPSTGQAYLGQTVALPEQITDPQTVQELKDKYSRIAARTGQPFIDAVYDNSVGSPVYARHLGKHLNPTDLDHLYHAWLIKTRALAAGLPSNPVICEIGGGFGGLARMLKQIFPAARVILLDLPEVVCTQTYYLTKSLPHARIVSYSDLADTPSAMLQLPGEYDFAVLPGFAIARLPEQSIDLFLNIRSMQEMNWRTIHFYFEHIHRMIRTGGTFCCINRYVKTTADHDPIILRNYPFDARWQPLVSETAPGQKSIHQLFLRRTAVPDTALSELLETLPSVDPKS